MKKIFLALLLCCGLFANAQIVFKNRDPKGALPKFIIKNGETEIYGKLGGKPHVLELFDQVPELYDNMDGRSRYRMTKTSNDNIARKTYEISYTLDRQTQKYGGGIIYTIDFHDKRPTKVFKEYFDSI
jgi:hypothetical protein